MVNKSMITSLMAQSSAQQWIHIFVSTQQMHCYSRDGLYKIYPISTAKNGLGEKRGSECTPRGWHRVHRIIGREHVMNSVFIGREWTGEIYSEDLSRQHPKRDWILTRIIQLDGLEPGFNQGGDVDSLERFIYIHGVPDSIPMSIPLSHGCVRMHNHDVIDLASWAQVGTLVYLG